MTDLEKLLTSGKFAGAYNYDSVDPAYQTPWTQRALFKGVDVNFADQRYAILKLAGLSDKAKQRRVDGLLAKIGRELSGSWFAWLTGGIIPQIAVNGDEITATYKLKDTSITGEGWLYPQYTRTVAVKVNKATGAVTANYVGDGQDKLAPRYLAGKDLTRLYSAFKAKSYWFVNPATTPPAPAPGPVPANP